MDSYCHYMGLPINYKKLLAVLQKMLPIFHLPLFFILTVIPLGWYHPSSTLEVLSPTIALWMLKYQHGSPKHFSHMGNSTAFFGTRGKIKSSTKLSVLVYVVLSVLLYGVETAVILELQVCHLQRFVMRCLCSILGVSLWDGKKDTFIRKIAHLQRLSTMLTQRRLQLLGHILRMDECRLPRKVLVCAPSQERRSVGGQRMQWNNLVLRESRNCKLEKVWRI